MTKTETTYAANSKAPFTAKTDRRAVRKGVALVGALALGEFIFAGCAKDPNAAVDKSRTSIAPAWYACQKAKWGRLVKDSWRVAANVRDRQLAAAPEQT